MSNTSLPSIQRTWSYTVGRLISRLEIPIPDLAARAAVSRTWLYKIEREPEIDDRRTTPLRPIVNVYRACWQMAQTAKGRRKPSVTLHELLGAPDLDSAHLAASVPPYVPPPPTIVEALPGVWWDTARLRALMSAELREDVSRRDLEQLGRRMGRVERGESPGTIALLVSAFDTFQAVLDRPAQPFTLHHILHIDPTAAPITDEPSS